MPQSRLRSSKRKWRSKANNAIRPPVISAFKKRRALLANVIGVLAVAVFPVCVAHAAPAAEGYPAKPVRLIVPFGTGGTDTIARVIAAQLTSRLGKQVITENRAGAGGQTRAVNRAPACGMRTSASRMTRRRFASAARVSGVASPEGAPAPPFDGV